MKIINNEHKVLATPETLGIMTYLSGQYIKNNTTVNGHIAQKEYDEKENAKNVELEQQYD